MTSISVRSNPEGDSGRTERLNALNPEFLGWVQSTEGLAFQEYLDSFNTPLTFNSTPCTDIVNIYAKHFRLPLEPTATPTAEPTSTSVPDPTPIPTPNPRITELEEEVRKLEERINDLQSRPIYNIWNDLYQ